MTLLSHLTCILESASKFGVRECARRHLLRCIVLASKWATRLLKAIHGRIGVIHNMSPAGD